MVKTLLKLLKNNFVLVLIALFFLATRLYKITEIPQSVYWDEASIGYNAYSIATDLKDEWGDKLPIHFRAFGEFKLPVYIYSVAVLTKIFGMGELSVRLPAVFYSLGGVVLVYFITKKITGEKSVALMASFIMSISPWLFIFSRTGYEATSGLFFFLLGIYLFIINPKVKSLFLCGVFFVIVSMYSYTSFRILAPPILLYFTFILLKNNFWKNLIVVFVSFLIFLVAIIPIARLFIYDAGFQRAQTFALIPGFQQVYDLNGEPHFQITYNRWQGVNWVENFKAIAKNYLSHFSYKFLLRDGDTNLRSQIGGHGQIYLLDLILAILGLVMIFKSKKLLYYLPLFMLLIAPIPASITRESPHALRSILMAPSFAIISSFGINFLINSFKKYAKFIFLIIIIFYLLFFVRYFQIFITDYNVRSASDWQNEYKKIFSEKRNGVITDKFGQPYIFALYYLKYPPQEFRKTVKYNPPDRWGFSTVSSFGEFQFK